MAAVQPVLTLLTLGAAVASALAAVAGLSEVTRVGRQRSQLRRTIDVWEKMPPGAGREALQRMIDSDGARLERLWLRRGRRVRSTFRRPATFVLVLGIGCVVLAVLDTAVWSRDRQPAAQFAQMSIRERGQSVVLLGGLSIAYLWTLLIVLGPATGRLIDRAWARRPIIKRARKIYR